jgi:hypothetical protein
MVLTDEGRIFVWGRGSFGRLGTGHEKDHYSPVEVFLPGTALSHASTALWLAFVLCSDFKRRSHGLRSTCMHDNSQYAAGSVLWQKSDGLRSRCMHDTCKDAASMFE